MQTKTSVEQKIPFMLAFSVGAVLFSAHAGGGFATGNQANTYYVGLGWLGPICAVAAISGAATALSSYFGLNYHLGIVIVGIVVLLLTIFGARLVRMATTYMGIAGDGDLVCDEHGGAGAVGVHADGVEGLLHVGGGWHGDPDADLVPRDGHGLADGGIRHLPAAVPDLHGRDDDLRVCGAV